MNALVERNSVLAMRASSTSGGGQKGDWDVVGTVAKQWAESSWAKGIAKKSAKAKLTDFERFKVMVARKTVSIYPAESSLAYSLQPQFFEMQMQFCG